MKYRVEGELKFIKAPNGNEICVEATGCEMFLWAERDKLLKFINDIGNFANGEGDAGNIIARRCRAMVAEAEGETA